MGLGFCVIAAARAAKAGARATGVRRRGRVRRARACTSPSRSRRSSTCGAAGASDGRAAFVGGLLRLQADPDGEGRRGVPGHARALAREGARRALRSGAKPRASRTSASSTRRRPTTPRARRPRARRTCRRDGVRGRFGPVLGVHGGPGHDRRRRGGGPGACGLTGDRIVRSNRQIRARICETETGDPDTRLPRAAFYLTKRRGRRLTGPQWTSRSPHDTYGD